MCVCNIDNSDVDLVDSDICNSGILLVSKMEIMADTCWISCQEDRLCFSIGGDMLVM